MDPTLSICHIHPDSAPSSERLPLPPGHWKSLLLGSDTMDLALSRENQHQRNCLKTKMTKHECSYNRGHKLAFLSQISPPKSLSGRCTVFKNKIACQSLNIVRSHIKVWVASFCVEKEIENVWQTGPTTTFSWDTNWLHLESRGPCQQHMPFPTLPGPLAPITAPPESAHQMSHIGTYTLLWKGKTRVRSLWPSSLGYVSCLALQAPEFVNYLKYIQHP